MSLPDIYTDAILAGDTIRSRWQDTALRANVEAAFLTGIPGGLPQEPAAAIWRQVGTPDDEFRRFLQVAQRAALKPVCLEFLEDKFSARNFTKYSLANLAFKQGVDKNKHIFVEREKIIDFAQADGKRMKDVTTLWGASLSDFHREFLCSVFPQMSGAVIDISDWLKAGGSGPKEFYVGILSLAVSHIVLFEDFDLLESEMGFVHEVVMPAYEEVEKRFGLKPMIVRISEQGEHAADEYWWCYAQDTRETVHALQSKNSS
jgi:hypothetical protein